MKRTKELNNKGFSLVEIIIVVAIMAVLLVIITPQYFKYVESSKEGTDEDTIRTVLTAIQTEAALKSFEGTTTLTFGDSALTVAGTDEDRIEDALTSVAIDPTKTKMQSAKYKGAKMTVGTDAGLPKIEIDRTELADALRIGDSTVTP